MSTKQKTAVHVIFLVIIAVVITAAIMLYSGKVQLPAVPVTTQETTATRELTPAEVMVKYRPDEEQSFGGYIARTYWDKEERNGYLVILHKGQVVLFEQFGRFSLPKPGSITSIGSDITGNGKPELLVLNYSGGAHCCTTFDLYELGESIRKVATINAGDGDPDFFRWKRGKRGLLFFGADDVFKNWYSSYADSPMPSIILHYCNGRYHIADDLMRKPPPTEKVLQAKVAAIQKEEAWGQEGVFPPLLWKEMLDLIYTGNAASAYRLFDMAWPERITGKASFLEAFRKQLAESEYWPQIKQMNEGKSGCRQ